MYPMLSSLSSGVSACVLLTYVVSVGDGECMLVCLTQHNTTTKNELNATISRLEYEIATVASAITTLRCRGYADENARPAKKQVTATATNS